MASLPPDAQKTLEQWVHGQPGGVSAAYVDGTGVTYLGAGDSGASQSSVIGPDTEFEIGSITKVFTALLLADAVSAGKVKLDQPVGAPFGASTVTYLELATHTSGLPRLPEDFVIRNPANPYATQDIASLTRSFNAAASRAAKAPTAYSNFGFAVLGHAVANAYGGAYEAELVSRVLQPLGLSDTKVSWRDADTVRLAKGYSAGQPVQNWDSGAYAPAGALVSTTRDMARLVQACLGLAEVPLRDAITDSMKPRVSIDARQEVGLAWRITHEGGATFVWHNGGTGGFRSFVVLDRDGKRGLVLLSNTDRNVDPLGWAWMTGKPVPVPAESRPPSDALAPLVGRYPLGPSFVMAVSADGDQLFVQATGQARLHLTPIEGDRYAVKGVTAEITFERDPNGNVIALVLKQNGRLQRAPRSAPASEGK